MGKKKRRELEAEVLVKKGVILLSKEVKGDWDLREDLNRGSRRKIKESSYP